MPAKPKKAKAKKTAKAKAKKSASRAKLVLKAGKKASTKKIIAKPKKATAPISKNAGKKMTKAESKAMAKIAIETKVTVIEIKGAKGTAKPNPKLNAKSPKTEKMALSGTPICREIACEMAATTKGYCRLHYIKNWGKIQRKEQILKEKKLNQYIEELVSKYPDKYIEAIRQDLSSEKDFAKVITDLEIEEDLDDFIDTESEAAENIVETIRRDFDDDDGDIF